VANAGYSIAVYMLLSRCIIPVCAISRSICTEREGDPLIVQIVITLVTGLDYMKNSQIYNIVFM
jgi:hypothetical protein